MRIRLAVPPDLDPQDQAAALDAALEAVTRANERDVERRRVPTFARALAAGRVRWRPEPPGDEHFDGARTVWSRGWGDCDDLAPWHAASLRVTGQDPAARAIVRRSGPRRWHAIVRRGDGSIADPSEAAGMRTAVVGAHPYAATWAPMVRMDDGSPGAAVAIHPWRDGWAGRVDLPVEDMPLALSGIGVARRPADAAARALRGAIAACGEDGEPVAALRLGALHDLLCGASPDVVGDALAHADDDLDLVGLAPIAASLAAPLAESVVSRIPGFGGRKRPKGVAAAPGAVPAGAGPGTMLTMPGGPIIVRF